MLCTVIVKPHSKKGPLVIVDDNIVTVYLREKPVDGKANAALIEILSDHFGVAKTCVSIKSGQNARRKLVEIIR